MDDELDVNRRFLLEVEQGIRISNNEVIHSKIPPVNAERMLSFAVSVSKLRLSYIEAAFAFADGTYADGEEGVQEVKELKLHRQRFEEARDAFIALQRAIELGYISTRSNTATE